jgi:hypothetical protein
MCPNPIPDIIGTMWTSLAAPTNDTSEKPVNISTKDKRLCFGGTNRPSNGASLASIREVRW